MARRKVKITDFIQTCETNSRLQYLADSFVPSCSLYDVIDGNYVPPQKEDKEEIFFQTYGRRRYHVYRIPFPGISDRGTGILS